MLGTEVVIEVSEWTLRVQSIRIARLCLLRTSKDAHNWGDARRMQLTWTTLSQKVLLCRYLFLITLVSHYLVTAFGPPLMGTTAGGRCK